MIHLHYQKRYIYIKILICFRKLVIKLFPLPYFMQKLLRKLNHDSVMMDYFLNFGKLDKQLYCDQSASKLEYKFFAKNMILLLVLRILFLLQVTFLIFIQLLKRHFLELLLQLKLWSMVECQSHRVKKKLDWN